MILSLSLYVLTAVFFGELWLAGARMFPFYILLELKMMVVMTAGAIGRSKLQSNCRH